MSGRDRRRLKSRIEQHRSQPPVEPPAPPAPVATPEPVWPSRRRPRHEPREESRRAFQQISDGRPLTVEYVALRLHEAVIRREGRDALDPGVAIDCVHQANLLLSEARRV